MELKKTYTIIAFFLLTSFIDVKAQEIKWLSLEQALKAQKVVPKKIFMDVFTKWCGPCKILDNKTFKNRDVANYISEHYYAVKFNGEGQEKINFSGNVFTNPNYNPARANRRNSTHQFTQFLRIRAYPTMVFISEQGDLIMPVQGYQTPQQLEFFLKMFKQGDHQVFSTSKDFQNYRKNFTPKFRG